MISRDLRFISKLGEDGLCGFSTVMQYICCFYWALSTMTVVCFSDITSQNNLCFFMVGIIIGNIGDLLGRIDAALFELNGRTSSTRSRRRIRCPML